MLGEAGIGKSALLADLTAHADACGLRVLSATGRERESGLPLAGLRQLLRPVLAELPALPAAPARALLAAVGVTAAGTVPRLDLAGTALLALLDHLALGDAPSRGLVAVVDDAQWIDRASLDVLAFAARRLDARPVSVVLAVRGDAPPAGFERDLPELRLGPLTTAEAHGLLDAQPCPPRGRAREQVLAQSAGNPLALIELTRTVTDNPGAEHSWAGLPLPLTDRLSAVFDARLGQFTAATRDALLLAAAADGADRDAVARAELHAQPGRSSPRPRKPGWYGWTPPGCGSATR